MKLKQRRCGLCHETGHDKRTCVQCIICREYGHDDEQCPLFYSALREYELKKASRNNLKEIHVQHERYCCSRLIQKLIGL